MHRLFLFYYSVLLIYYFFFFNDTATTEIYTLSLHDALPIFQSSLRRQEWNRRSTPELRKTWYLEHVLDRKSTRLNSSHITISYAVFCLKKKKKQKKQTKTNTTPQKQPPTHTHATAHPRPSTR